MISQKTILIPITRGVLVRNVLRSNALSGLLEKNCKVVIVLTDEIKNYFRNEFSHPNIVFEKVCLAPTGRLHKLFLTITKGLVYTISERRHIKYGTMGKPPVSRSVGFLKHYGFTVLNRLIFLRPIARWIENNYFVQKELDYLFEKYKPELVFSTGIYAMLDMRLVKTAKRLGVLSVTMPKSWDNIGRMYFPVLADKIILNNESMIPWLEKEQGLKRKDAYVTGMPQFDIYKAKKKYLSKEEFCKKTGLDPGKPILIFAAEGLLTHWDDIYIRDLVEQCGLLEKYNLILRPHFSDLLTNKYDDMINHEGVYFDNKDVRITDMFCDRWDPTVENMDWLAEVLNQADVVIAFMSTFVLDAFVYDKPVVNIYYDLPTDRERVIPMKELYQFIHYQLLLKIGAVPLAKSADEVMNWLDTYVKDPSIKSEERSKTLKEFCYKLDGNAGVRIADCITKLLNQNNLS